MPCRLTPAGCWISPLALAPLRCAGINVAPVPPTWPGAKDSCLDGRSGDLFDCFGACRWHLLLRLLPAN